MPISDNRQETKISQSSESTLRIPKPGTPAVVLSRNYSTGLSVIRSLGEAGFAVDLVASAPEEGASAMISASRYIHGYTEVVSKKMHGGRDMELEHALLKYRGRYDGKILLFPTDDYTAYMMDESRDALRDIFAMPRIAGSEEPGALAEMMNKVVQGRMAAVAGLNVPRQWVVSLEKSTEPPEGVTYPCFVKPIESIHGYKREMRCCESEGELRRHLLRLRRRYIRRKIMIQEFLDIENEVDIQGVCIDRQIIIPGVIRKTHVAEHEKGVTLAGVVQPYETLPETVRSQIEKLLGGLRYTGIFDMELNISKGEYYFNEINFRSGGPNFAYYMSGVNLPALAGEEIMGWGHDPEDEKIKEFGKSLLYEDAAWKDYINGFMSKKELDSAIAGADIRIFYFDKDPEPWKVFSSSMGQKNLRTKTKNIVRGTLKGMRRTVSQQVRAVEPYVLRYPQTTGRARRAAEAGKPRALVIGRNYASNLSLSRALGLAGYDVQVVRLFQRRKPYRDLLRGIRPEVYSRYVSDYQRLISHRIDSNTAYRLLTIGEEWRESGHDEKMVLLTADDVVADICDRFYDELSEYYYLQSVGGKGGGIDRLMNKSIQKKLAEDAGLNVAGWHVIKVQQGEYAIPDGISYPCFIKPNMSRYGSKSKMLRCDSRDELEEGLELYCRQRRSTEVMVEDYIEIKNEYSLLGVSTGEKAIGPCFFRAEVGGHAEHRGVALLGRILPTEEYRPLIDRLLRFIESLDFEGVYDIDLIEGTDGRMYYAETNFRYGASAYAFCECGVNLAGIYADWRTKGIEPDPGIRVTETGRLFTSEKILIDEYYHNRISLKDLKEYISEADIHLISSGSDPGPYRHFRKYYKNAGLGGVLRKVRDRLTGDEE
jgi:predicted ATP-grasp superfamily ATP-dependent carboligase